MASSMMYSLSRSRSDQCPSSSTLTETETIAEHVRGGVDGSSSCHHPCHHHDGAVGVDREDYASMSHLRLLRVLNTVKLSSVVRLLDKWVTL